MSPSSRATFPVASSVMQPQSPSTQQAAAYKTTRTLRLQIVGLALMVLGMSLHVRLGTHGTMLVHPRRLSETPPGTGERWYRALQGVQPEGATRAAAAANQEAGTVRAGTTLVSAVAADFKRCQGPEPGTVIPHLLSMRQWRSSRARQRESVTVVTQLSLERLEMLTNQCSVWPGPIAAVVYAPTVRGLIFSAEDSTVNGAHMEEAVARLNSFYERMQRKGACALDLELATQDFEDELEASLYPFNAARNRALVLAQTEALLLLDADFVPSPALAAQYSTLEAYAELLRQLEHPQAIVLPAFETASSGPDGQKLALAVVQGGKAAAVAEYRRGTLQMFAKHFQKGHLHTNYSLWTSHDRPYVIRHHAGYEPYVLISRRFVPWYDERFRGYGWDKIQHLAHIAGLNFTLTAHTTAFVVHVPHRRAATYQATKDSGERQKLKELFTRVNRDIGKHRFVPVVSFPQLCTKPSWRLAMTLGTAQLEDKRAGTHRHASSMPQA